MSFIKSMWSDLVEKRLWPVALVLVIALVAVPVLLGSSSASVEAPLGATGGTGPLAAPGERAQVGLEATGAVRRDRLGRVRDPFEQREIEKTDAPKPAATDAAAATPDAKAGEAAPADGGAADGGTTAPQPTTPDRPQPPKVTPPAPDPRDSFRVVLRISRGGTTAKARSVERLTPLPSVNRPFLVPLGVLTDERTAVFLVSSDVSVSGDGSCRPRRSSCETLELRAGDSTLLTVKGEPGAPVERYRLELLRITKDGVELEPSTRPVPVDGPVRVARQDPEGFDGADRYVLDARSGLLRSLGARRGLRNHLPQPDEPAQLRSAPLTEETEETEEEPDPDGPPVWQAGP